MIEINNRNNLTLCHNIDIPQYAKQCHCSVYVEKLKPSGNQLTEIQGELEGFAAKLCLEGIISRFAICEKDSTSCMVDATISFNEEVDGGKVGVHMLIRGTATGEILNVFQEKLSELSCRVVEILQA